MPSISPQRRKRLILSYLPDWIITIVLAAIFFALDEVPGYRRDFSLTDTSLLHPYAEHERIPNKILWIIAIVAPLVLNWVFNFLTVRSWWDAHCATLGLILGLATTGSITQFVKITVGRPRPDIISRCMPATGSADPLWGLSTSEICTTTNEKVLKDGFRSFFSGHSSLSFAGLGFLSFYLAGKFHLFDRRGHAFKTWLCLTPFAGAALVAISRSMDYRHHWHDILVGSLVGTVLAYFSYRQYYPSLASPHSHRPYSPRITSESTAHADAEDAREHAGRDGTVMSDMSSTTDDRSPAPLHKPLGQDGFARAKDLEAGGRGHGLGRGGRPSADDAGYDYELTPRAAAGGAGTDAFADGPPGVSGAAYAPVHRSSGSRELGGYRDPYAPASTGTGVHQARGQSHGGDELELGRVVRTREEDERGSQYAR
jgi:diacylglycerol diphosphate phosphatase/phosphatidate phosphatase